MSKIVRSVGRGGVNLYNDVIIIQKLLNKQRLPGVTGQLKYDGKAGKETIGRIEIFQKNIVKMSKPDGRIDPGGKTMAKLTGTTQSKLPGLGKLTEADFQAAAKALGAEIAAIKAVASVESAGGGYLNDGRLKILFEGHWFSGFTESKYDKSHPTISYKKWTKAHYKGGEAEYSRLNLAENLNKEAAWKATSWGKFQIMGFNHQEAGYTTVEGFVNAMKESEGKQLLAFVKFLKSKKLDSYLISKDWANFAKGYNGPKYAENKYDKRLKQAYDTFSKDK